MTMKEEQKITLFQLHKTREMIDFVNGPNGGWDNAAKKYPAMAAYLKTVIDSNGSEGWEPSFFKHYRAVAVINTNDIEESFAIGNAYGGSHMEMVEMGKIEPLLPLITLHNGHETLDMHSMSIGDIVKKGQNYWMCDPIGFSQIKVEEN